MNKNGTKQSSSERQGRQKPWLVRAVGERAIRESPADKLVWMLSKAIADGGGLEERDAGEIATHLGTTVPTVIRWLRGKSKPNKHSVAKLRRYLTDQRRVLEAETAEKAETTPWRPAHGWMRRAVSKGFLQGAERYELISVLQQAADKGDFDYLSWDDMASRLGVSSRTARNWSDGSRQPLTAESTERLRRFLLDNHNFQEDDYQKVAETHSGARRRSESPSNGNHLPEPVPDALDRAQGAVKAIEGLRAMLRAEVNAAVKRHEDREHGEDTLSNLEGLIRDIVRDCVRDMLGQVVSEPTSTSES